MCIFTYTPIEGGLLFTSNRDEVVSRPTSPPDRYPHKGEVLIYPRDHQKGGSWIGMNLTTNTLGVPLNAKTKTPLKPMEFSRGWILLDLITQTVDDRFNKNLKQTPHFNASAANGSITKYCSTKSIGTGKLSPKSIWITNAPSCSVPTPSTTNPPKFN